MKSQPCARHYLGPEDIAMKNHANEPLGKFMS